MSEKTQEIPISNDELSRFLSPEQVAELKETFSLFDQDHDKLISEDDLKIILQNLGIKERDSIAKEMMAEVGGKPINFLRFISMFEKFMRHTDPEQDIMNAFRVLDLNGTGKIRVVELRDMLMSMGDKMKREDVDELMRHANIKDGKIDYAEFVRMIKYGAMEVDTGAGSSNSK